MRPIELRLLLEIANELRRKDVDCELPVEFYGALFDIEEEEELKKRATSQD